MKILNFGSCNIDYVYNIDHIVVPGETEIADCINKYPGGKGLNQSIAISKSGSEVFHAACVGNDAEMLLKILSECGVNTKYIRTLDIPNGHAIIQVSEQGENSIFIYPGSNARITVDFVDSVLEQFSSGDIILLQNEMNNVKYIIDKAYEKKMTVVFNPSPFNKSIDEVDFNKISYLILNEVEARGVSGEDNPDEILKYFRNTYPQLKVVLTLGEKGCIYTDNLNTYSQPAFRTNVVDTTAAGDTFTGYFVSGIARKLNIRDILNTASCAAAIAVSRKGAAPSIPYKNEVDSVVAKDKYCGTMC